MKKLVVSALAFFAATAAIWWAAGTRPGLVVRHQLRTELKRLQAVTIVEVEGVEPLRMFLDPDDRMVTNIIMTQRQWEATETYWFLQSVRPGDVVVDVGANIGYYTLLAASRVGESGRVYAFEPDPTAFELLEKNVRLNGFTNVVLEQKAASNEPGTLRLYLAEANRGDHRIYQPRGQGRPYVEVEAVALDGYFTGREDRLDFVKVDTQGAEAVILAGMTGIVRKSDAIVMAMEFSPRMLAGLGSSAEELLDGLGDLELRMFELSARRLRRAPPVERADLLRRFTPDKGAFTNLLLVKGRPDVLAALRDQS